MSFTPKARLAVVTGPARDIPYPRNGRHQATPPGARCRPLAAGRALAGRTLNPEANDNPAEVRHGGGDAGVPSPLGAPRPGRALAVSALRCSAGRLSASDLASLSDWCRLCLWLVWRRT